MLPCAGASRLHRGRGRGHWSSLDDLSNARAETGFELGQASSLALVFEAVVQERGDGIVFGTAVFEHEGGNGEEVRDVGNVAALAHLIVVKAVRIHERVIKLNAEPGGLRHWFLPSS